jgi:hypothetical protein
MLRKTYLSSSSSSLLPPLLPEELMTMTVQKIIARDASNAIPNPILTSRNNIGKITA